MPGKEVTLPCLLLLLLLLTLPFFVWSAGFEGIPGNYCRFRKPSECCSDRFDDCSVKIRDTLCYCDEFCLNKDITDLHDDCCPDYREMCLGILPEPLPEIGVQSDEPRAYTNKGCVRDGVVVPDLATHKFNCHSCKCEGGQLECEKDACLVDESTIKRVNQKAGGYTWRATNYTKFWGWKAWEGVKLRTGALAPSFVMHPIRLTPVASLIPREFNAGEKRDWRGLISGVRDQGWCGASWAFSSVAVAQDRLAIMTRDGSRQLSPEQLVECAHQTQDSCRVGGHLNRAWNYLRTIGVVREECLPYQSGKLSKAPECQVPRGSTTMLHCESPDLYKMEPAYRISSKQDDIQWEIMENGPLQALMHVSPELFVYASGVYQCDRMGTDDGLTSLHAVRLVGWGEEVLQFGASPTKYWVVANSWGQDWGEGGYFRIRRGSDECSIESYVHAVRPRLANLVYGN